MKQKNQSRKKMNKKTNRKKKNYKKSFRKGKSFNLRNKTLKHKIKLHGKADLHGGSDLHGGAMENQARINMLTDILNGAIEDGDNQKIQRLQTEINDLKKIESESLDSPSLLDTSKTIVAPDAIPNEVPEVAQELAPELATELATVGAQELAPELVPVGAPVGAPELATVGAPELATELATVGAPEVVPEESKETGEQSQTDTEVQTTTTMSEDDKYKKVTIIVRIPKNGMVETFSDGDTAKQMLTSLTTGRR
jgi:hypothetical protein